MSGHFGHQCHEASLGNCVTLDHSSSLSNPYSPQIQAQGRKQVERHMRKNKAGEAWLLSMAVQGYTASLQEDHSNQSICEQYPHWIGSGRIYKITSRGPIHCQWHCKLPVPTQCLPLTNMSEQPAPQTSALLCNFGPSVNTLRIHPS